MDKITEHRLNIDKSDSVIVKALEERLKNAIEIGLIKKEKGLPIYNPEREKIVLEHIKSLVKDDRFIEPIQKIYQFIMDITKDLEK